MRLLQRCQHPVVEHETGAGHPREHPARDVAGGAGWPGDDHAQRRRWRQDPLERGLVLVDDRAALQRHAAVGESRRHHRQVVVDGGQRRADRDEANAGDHSHPRRRASSTSRSA
jgi:hypothetical protein